MTDNIGEYHKLAVKSYPARGERETAEGRYWRRLGSPALLQQIAAVTHIDFCPTSPFDFAATSSTRVRPTNHYDGGCLECVSIGASSRHLFIRFVCAGSNL